MKLFQEKHFRQDLAKEAIKASFKMMTPKAQFSNPVMFVTYLSAVASTLHLINAESVSWFEWQITGWLWATVLFANFAQSFAESRGKAQADSLKKTKFESLVRKLVGGKETKISADALQKGDLIVCEAGELIPADGEVVEGIASIDESAITGESAPVIRESGGDRSAVTAGTKLLTDRLVIRVTSERGHSFLDRMINLIEGSKRQKTPNEIALHIVLTGLTLILLLTTISLKFFADYSVRHAPAQEESLITLPVLLALLVCLIPTTISALLSAVGIAGMDRLVKRNVIAKSGRSVEAAGDIDLLILDKTGTITIGNRLATAFFPASPLTEKEFAEIAQLASLSDETPEGRSIVVLAKNTFGLRASSINTLHSSFIPFSAHTRMSGIDLKDSQGNLLRSIRKGAVDAIRAHVQELGGNRQEDFNEMIISITKQGGTPLMVSDGNNIVGLIQLKDVVKGGIKERFAAMRKMGIRTIMVTGDNALTAAAIAAEAGVDDYIAEATPEKKLELIKNEQGEGHLVAMTGDGTNDAPALAQADVAVAMNTGTQASREAGNMVDLDSNPTKLIDIVEIGKQMLITRGALTTFSIANDLAKYFAIIPAIFATIYLVKGEAEGPLSVLNIMSLHNKESAILSSVIFNALIILVMIPLALRGVSYKPCSADEMLKNNILIYGLGGVIAPFVGIKIIDLFISFILRLA